MGHLKPGRGGHLFSVSVTYGIYSINLYVLDNDNLLHVTKENLIALKVKKINSSKAMR